MISHSNCLLQEIGSNYFDYYRPDVPWIGLELNYAFVPYSFVAFGAELFSFEYSVDYGLI